MDFGQKHQNSNDGKEFICRSINVRYCLKYTKETIKFGEDKIMVWVFFCWDGTNFKYLYHVNDIVDQVQYKYKESLKNQTLLFVNKKMKVLKWLAMSFDFFKNILFEANH